MPVIKDPDWEHSLHGECIMKVAYKGEVYRICTAKVIDHCSGRCNNPYNLAVMIRFRQTYEQWRELPWYAVCNDKDEELFLLQAPFPEGTIGRMTVENRVLTALKIREYGYEKWLSEHNIPESEYNNYQRIVENFKKETE